MPWKKFLWVAHAHVTSTHALRQASIQPVRHVVFQPSPPGFQVERGHPCKSIASIRLIDVALRPHIVKVKVPSAPVALCALLLLVFLSSLLVRWATVRAKHELCAIEVDTSDAHKRPGARQVQHGLRLPYVEQCDSRATSRHDEVAPDAETHQFIGMLELFLCRWTYASSTSINPGGTPVLHQ